MTIAVNAGFPDFYSTGNDAHFIIECFSRLALRYPQHQFIYIFDKAFDTVNIASKNSTPVVIGLPAKNPLLLQYWFNYKIPALLRKHKVDVFVSAGGYCSLRSKVPQCLIINDLSFLHHPQLFTRSWLRFYKSNTVKFLTKAKTIVSHSQFLKKEIITHYKIADDKISVAYHGIGENFTAIGWQQKDAVKQTHTQGLEYFLYSGPIHPQQNLMALLKAFSFFKKRQKSNMQLVIASTTKTNDAAFIKSLASFKYRKEVKLLEHVPDASMTAITAAAYAVVYTPIGEGFGWSLTEAMYSDVPVITSRTGTNVEICGDAALYVNPNDFNDIADKMMLLFKDENMRNKLIAKGRQQAGLYNWNKTIAVVWDALLKCTS